MVAAAAGVRTQIARPRTFTEWVASGALEWAWAILLREYDAAIGLDWSWQAADGCIVKAPFGKKGAPARRRPRGQTPPTAANPAPNGTG